MDSFTLRPEVLEALREWNQRTQGRGMIYKSVVDDPATIARLQKLAFTGEDLNDTLLRMLRGESSKLN